MKICYAPYGKNGRTDRRKAKIDGNKTKIEIEMRDISKSNNDRDRMKAVFLCILSLIFIRVAWECKANVGDITSENQNTIQNAIENTATKTNANLDVNSNINLNFFTSFLPTNYYKCLQFFSHFFLFTIQSAPFFHVFYYILMMPKKNRFKHIITKSNIDANKEEKENTQENMQELNKNKVIKKNLNIDESHILAVKKHFFTFTFFSYLFGRLLTFIYWTLDSFNSRFYFQRFFDLILPLISQNFKILKLEILLPNIIIFNNVINLSFLIINIIVPVKKCEKNNASTAENQTQNKDENLIIFYCHKYSLLSLLMVCCHVHSLYSLSLGFSSSPLLALFSLNFWCLSGAVYILFKSKSNSGSHDNNDDNNNGIDNNNNNNDNNNDKCSDNTNNNDHNDNNKNAVSNYNDNHDDNENKETKNKIKIEKNKEYRLENVQKKSFIPKTNISIENIYLFSALSLHTAITARFLFFVTGHSFDFGSLQVSAEKYYKFKFVYIS